MIQYANIITLTSSRPVRRGPSLAELDVMFL
jgi:hypothetical protein